MAKMTADEFEAMAAAFKKLSKAQQGELAKILAQKKDLTAATVEGLNALKQEIAELNNWQESYDEIYKRAKSIGEQNALNNLQTEIANQQAEAANELSLQKYKLYKQTVDAGHALSGAHAAEYAMLKKMLPQLQNIRKANLAVEDELGPMIGIYTNLNVAVSDHGKEWQKLGGVIAKGLEENATAQERLSGRARRAAIVAENAFHGLATQIGAQAPAITKELEKWKAAMGKGGAAAAAYTLERAITQMTKFADMGLSKLWSTAKDLVIQFDAQTKMVDRQLQTGPKVTAQIKEQYTALNELGVTMEEVAKAQMVLTKTVTDFTLMTDSQQMKLKEAAIVAGKLGQSMEDYGGGVQTSMKMMGQSMEGAIQVQGELAATAQALGRDQTEFAADFAKSGSALAKFGTDGAQAFKNLQHAAKISGMEMGKILQLTNKFDTFESAAEMSGKLNAALGGNFVNAMDMMMDTDPVSRFESVRDAILDSGLSFDTMSYYQKQFYTESLGLGDVGDLAVLLSGNMEDLAGSTNLSAEALVEQKDRAKSVMDIQMQLQAILADNADVILDLADDFQDFVTFMTSHAKGMIRLFIGWKVATMGMAVVNTFFAASNTAVAASGKGAARSIGMIAVAVAALAIPFMIASPSKLVLAMFALGAGIFILGKIGKGAAPGVLAIGIAMVPLAFSIMMIGTGVGIAAAGLGLLAAGFSLMFKAIDPVKMLAFGAFAGLMAMVSPLLPLAALGLTGLAGAMGLVAGALVLMAPGLLVFTAFTASMILLTTSVDSLGRVAEEFSNIAAAIEEIPTVKAVAVSVMATTMAEAAVAAATAGPRALATQVTQIAGGSPLASAGAPTAAQNTSLKATLKLDGDATTRFLKGQAETVVGEIARSAGG